MYGNLLASFGRPKGAELMCGIAYVPNEALEGLDVRTLERLFNALQLNKGGDGNGIGGWISAKPYITKGVDLSSRECAEIAKASRWDSGIIFHSRHASHGTVCDRNCHPFHYERFITCHNGTWIPTDRMLDLVKEAIPAERLASGCTDSEMIAALVGKFFWRISGQIDNGVIMMLAEEYPIVSISSTGRLYKIGLKNGSQIYASIAPAWCGTMAHKLEKGAYFLFGNGADAVSYEDGGY